MGAWAVLDAEGLSLSSPRRWGAGQTSPHTSAPVAMSALSGHSLWTRAGLSGQAPEVPRGSWGVGGKGPSPLTGSPSCSTQPMPPAHRARGAGSSVPEDGADEGDTQKIRTPKESHTHAWTQGWIHGQRQADQHPQKRLGPPWAHTNPSRTYTHIHIHTVMLTSAAALTSQLPSRCPQSPLPGQAQCPSGGTAPCPGEGSRRGWGKEPRRVRPSCH